MYEPGIIATMMLLLRRTLVLQQMFQKLTIDDSQICYN